MFYDLRAPKKAKYSARMIPSPNGHPMGTAVPKHTTHLQDISLYSLCKPNSVYTA